MLRLPTYVLISLARNEAELIKFIVGRTIRPASWVIVSDGSTDRTDEVVRNYADQHDWIELVRLPGCR